MEFFEHGVALHGTSLFPWIQVNVRDSQFFPDRIVVVVRSTVGSFDAEMYVVQVNDRLRSRIKAVAVATGKSERHTSLVSG
jgi:hypothetical protein